MKFLKNRLVIVVVCILVAIGFLTLNNINIKSHNKTTEVVSVVGSIKKGDKITKDKVKAIQVGGYGVSTNFVKDTKSVIDQYALADFAQGDYILKDKVANKLPTSDEKLIKLDGSRVAISVNLKDFARGLSDKIISGDIVSCIITTEKGTQIPPELNYVEVLTTTTKSGVDKEKASDKEEDNLATATLLATPAQAQLLADYDKNAELHLALVYRGDEKTAKTFLDKQNQFLSNK
ncbi:RcpC/CpaB family pilus assembly protein [Paludicola sp. MB14-C6]|uniref:Flp pilus assembly protein CpaB n=1 Tax=Paludihabitans sp. MB14-C6 TaxID=3070656 RepID=UPI0027DC37EF|nr:RcpC/CpaB family pilus assembly protein [Paludicola sp. MB14-C6]WMJ24316.1 RcpC/CpaB family pilus assembly protein [Paludicola sp. MB14-C6]